MVNRRGLDAGKFEAWRWRLARFEAGRLTVAAFCQSLERQVLPHSPDTWYDESSTKIDDDISFYHYFYRPQALRILEAIGTDILSLNEETEGLLAKIIRRPAK